MQKVFLALFRYFVYIIAFFFVFVYFHFIFSFFFFFEFRFYRLLIGSPNEVVYKIGN